MIGINVCPPVRGAVDQRMGFVHSRQTRETVFCKKGGNRKGGPPKDYVLNFGKFSYEENPPQKWGLLSNQMTRKRGERRKEKLGGCGAVQNYNQLTYI